MDNQRLFLFIALFLTILLLWEAWQRDYGQRPPVASSAETSAETPAKTPAATAPDLPALTQAPAAAPAPTGDRVGLPSGARIHVTTDVLDVIIDTQGGDIRQVKLLDYPVSTDAPDISFLLMGDQPPDLFVAQAGLRSTDGPEATHHVRFRAERDAYRMSGGELVVPLHWEGAGGVTVTKSYVFQPGSYVIQVRQLVKNGSDRPWRGRQYRQLQRSDVKNNSGSKFIKTYLGGVIYSPEEKYEKIKFSDMQEMDLNREITNGWAAMIQHYFLGAWIPVTGEANHYYTKSLGDNRFVLGLIGMPQLAEPGEQTEFSSRLYVGPKIQKRLEELAPGLELTVDYGVLTVLAKPLFWLLVHIHTLMGNWGWAIILLTVIIKLVFYKLSETSYKSMANMRKLAPRLQALKERYGDDRQKLNQAMMDLYKTEKINPLGGCLPIVVQIPVFIALYWVLLESVELRQASFLWLHDLSIKDPFFVLPLVMGATMLIQQKLNPAPMDPVQAKVMMILPIVFTVFFAFFPSGLVLYWVVNNTLSIAQQWVITKRVEAAKK